MKFKPIKMYDSLNNGSYKGIIKEIAFNNERYFTFKIEIEGKDGLFIHMFPTNDIVFNNFTYDFVDDEKCFAPDKLIEKNIQFDIIERVYGDNKYHKITSINVVE